MSEHRQSLERPSTSLSKAADWLIAWAGGEPSAAGVAVNEVKSIQVSAVLACVRVLSESVASLPLQLFRMRADGGKEIVRDHPVYRLIHDTPNDEQTSYYFRETQQARVTLWGNSYALILRSRNGTPAALEPLASDRVIVGRDGARVFYEFRPPQGSPERFASDQILHIPGLGFDGISGLSVIAAHRQGIGLSIAAERFGARFFGSGSHPTGVLQTDAKLSDDAHMRIAQSWNDAYSGTDNAHRVAVLEQGLKWSQLTIPPEDAQFLETRKFQVEDIARIFRVPPHMIGHLERATFSNIEQQGIDFLVHTLRAWLVRWEQELNRKLLTETEREELFTQFNVDGLLRGDSQARATFYKEMWMNGFMTRNEIRAKENLNPSDDPTADSFYVPLNMMPTDQPVVPPSDDEGIDSDGGDGAADPDVDGRSRSAVPGPELRANQVRSVEARLRLQQAHKRLFIDAVERILRREIERVSRQAKKLLSATPSDPDAFRKFLFDFYTEFREFVAKRIAPVVAALSESIQGEVTAELDLVDVPLELDAFVRDYVDAFAIRYTAASRGQLIRLLDDFLDSNEAQLAIEERLRSWEETRAEAVAVNESIRAGSAIALAAYTVAGIVYIRWVTVGENCPLCRTLDGKVVGVKENFVDAGKPVDPGGGRTPLRPRRSIGHPPLHKGCDCQIVAD